MSRNLINLLILLPNVEVQRFLFCLISLVKHLALLVFPILYIHVYVCVLIWSFGASYTEHESNIIVVTLYNWKDNAFSTRLQSYTPQFHFCNWANLCHARQNSHGEGQDMSPCLPHQSSILRYSILVSGVIAPAPIMVFLSEINKKSAIFIR